MFRSLHMKLMLILLLLITSLMAVVGAFLTTSVSSFYINTFYQQRSTGTLYPICGLRLPKRTARSSCRN